MFLTEQFFCFIRDGLVSAGIGDIKKLSRQVKTALNQEFLRARYGGLYHTIKGSRDMYFRVPSIDFDWYPVIRTFAEAHIKQIDSITVVRDDKSIGAKDYSYQTPD